MEQFSEGLSPHSAKPMRRILMAGFDEWDKYLQKI